MNLSRRSIIGGALVLLISIGVIVAAFWLRGNNLATQQQQVIERNVNITINKDVTVDIFPAAEGTEEQSQLADPVTTLEQSQQIRLPQGAYYVISRSTPQFDQFKELLVVDEQDLSIVVDPKVSQQRLQSLLSAERPAIMAAITAAFPTLQSLYTIEQGWLYENGDWYATKLIYKGSDASQADTLRLVAHKEGNAWKAITTPPDITVSSVKYPNIPHDVVVDINNFR